MIKLLSLFSGIGAFEKALENIDEPFEVVRYCEIDKYASKAYSLIHNLDESMNLKDVCSIDTDELPKDIDVVSYGFPCQDISIAGNRKGFTDESGNLTRSGLFFEALRIIEDVQPKVAIAENVKALVSKRFTAEFKIVLDSLNDAGYKNYWSVLDAKDYGIPQHRERVFIVSIRKDIDHGFVFPDKYELKLRLRDMLEKSVDEKFYIKNFDSITFVNENYSIINGGTIGKMHDISRRVYDVDGVSPTIHICGGDNTELKIIDKPRLVGGVGERNFGKQFRQGNRIYDADGIATTLSASPLGNAGGNTSLYKVGYEIRKLTPKECFRLMGFDDNDFDTLVANKISNSQLYKMAGNSIVVDVLEELFVALLNQYENVFPMGD